MKEYNNRDDKEYLIAELKKVGIKHTPENIIRISQDSNGKIIFLETGRRGKRGSGLQHILENHQQDFLNRGISNTEIPDIIIKAVSQGKMIGIQGKSRRIYQIEFNQIIQYISVEISNNGYIVSANPTPTKLINRIIDK